MAFIQYSTEGKIKEPNLAAEAGMGLMNVMKSYAQKDMGGVFQGAMGLFKTATGRTQKAEEYARRTRTSPADAVRLSDSMKIIFLLLTAIFRSHGADARTRRRVRTQLKLVLRLAP